MEEITMRYNVAKKLTKSTFTRQDYNFGGWNTKADGTGTTYQDGQEVHSLVANKGENITLYAIYEKFSYENENDLIFDGSNYIDTSIYIFSEKNINKDFEISFEIKDYTYANDQNSLISAMDERASPWPGFVFRFTKSNQFEINSNTTSSVKGSKQYGLKDVNKVIIKRTNNILYVSINDGIEQQIIDFSTIKQPFYAPTSIGASLNGNLQPQRYFTGTLSNVRITVNQ